LGKLLPRNAVLLFEDHASTQHFVCANRLPKSPHLGVFSFLELKGWIASASAVEQAAAQAGIAPYA
jgi:hypothetical protein